MQNLFTGWFRDVASKIPAKPYVYKYLYPLALLGLFSVSTIVPYTFWCALLGVWLFLRRYAIGVPSRVFYLALTVGMGKYGASLWWFFSVYPLTWLGLPAGFWQIAVIGVYWLISTMVLSLSFASMWLFYTYVVRVPAIRILSAPVIWVLAEIIASLVFSVYVLGPGATLNISLSFGYLGYVLADVPWLLGYAWYGGVYALGFVLVASMSLVWFWQRRYYRSVGIVACVVIGLGIYVPMRVINYTPTPEKYAAITTSFTVKAKLSEQGFLSNFSETKAAVSNALARGAEVIILPEDNRFTYGFPTSAAVFDHLEQSALRHETILIDSARVFNQEGETVLRAFIYDTEREQVYTVDKQYLAPQGEYTPYFYQFFIKLLASDSLQHRLSTTIDFRPGEAPDYTRVPETIPPVLFCVESLNPRAVRQLLRQQPSETVAHVVSHAWFNDPHSLWVQLHRMLSTQAVWNQVTIIEAANQKPGQYYYPDGTRVPIR